MKRKLIVIVLLVVVCLGVLVVEGVSQPVPPASSNFAPQPLPPSPSAAIEPPPVATRANFSTVQQQQQEWTFEQLVEALKGVRLRQKELQAQEADLLAKMAQKIEDKRNDLQKSEAALQQLRDESRRVSSPVRYAEWEKKRGEKKMEDKR